MQEILEKLEAQVGTEVGVSKWWEITQDRIDAFAEATDDHQFIHVNPELAAQTPFGSTIAHGFLTLSLSVPMSTEIPFDVGSPMMAINYGLDRVRFPAPVPVNSRIRLRMTLDEVSEVPGGIQIKQTVTTEIEDEDKPAMVAERLSRFYY
ncbi:MAG TPA: MaoC family dehydratase [Acidimicrobiia bacterium]|nr:MaoC family dehydratase [Acidimicrobiia bacterium]